MIKIQLTKFFMKNFSQSSVFLIVAEYLNVNHDIGIKLTTK